LYQPLSSHFICITAYVSTQCLGISLHQFPFCWLAYAGTLNLLTHFTHHLSIVHFVFVNNHIILHHHYVRQLLLLFYFRRGSALVNMLQSVYGSNLLSSQYSYSLTLIVSFTIVNLDSMREVAVVQTAV